MRNSIELHLSTQSFSIPEQSMKPQHIMEAINMLTNELFERLPDHMYVHAKETLMENLYEAMKEQHQHDTDDDLPF